MSLDSLKDTLWLVIMWFAWSITHILNKVRKGETMTFKQHFSHLVISWFVGFISYEVCLYFWIDWAMQSIIIWMSSYSGIKIIDTFELVTPQDLYNLISNKTWLWKK